MFKNFANNTELLYHIQLIILIGYKILMLSKCNFQFNFRVNEYNLKRHENPLTDKLNTL